MSENLIIIQFDSLIRGRVWIVEGIWLGFIYLHSLIRDLCLGFVFGVPCLAIRVAICVAICVSRVVSSEA